MRERLPPGARPTAEGKRTRNKSVSDMEKACVEPPEEEEEERAVVNGNGAAVTPGQSAAVVALNALALGQMFGNPPTVAHTESFSCRGHMTGIKGSL